jgi:hypothetical protein
MRFRYPVLVILILLSATTVFGQDETTKGNEAYCKYITEQAMAQRDLLRSPSGVVGPIEPSSGTPPQLVFGVTEDLTDYKKAKLTMSVAVTTCKLYDTTTDAQRHLLYALPSIEKSVLQNRLILIGQATAQLDDLIAESEKMVEVQNLTRPALYTLQSAKVRLDASRTEALTGLTSPYVPPLSNIPLRVLIADKAVAETANQKTTIKLEKQATWDFKLEGGVHRQITAPAVGTTSGGPYGLFSLTYNFGRKAVDKHYDKSADAYSEWKENQFDDVSAQSRVLQKQIEDTITIQEDQLRTLQEHDVQIAKDLATLTDASTSAALAFKNQLLADEITLRVDIKDVQFRIESLKQYLVDNF